MWAIKLIVFQVSDLSTEQAGKKTSKTMLSKFWRITIRDKECAYDCFQYKSNEEIGVFWHTLLKNLLSLNVLKINLSQFNKLPQRKPFCRQAERLNQVFSSAQSASGGEGGSNILTRFFCHTLLFFGYCRLLILN